MLNHFIKFTFSSLAFFALAGCFSESGDDSSAGKLFSGHKSATNVFILNPNYGGTFIEGDRITLNLTHSFAITVTGTPRIAIDLDGTPVFANYISGTGTKTIRFEYIFQAGENDNDGAIINPTIDLNGGTLKYTENAVINDANTSFTVPSGINVIIDTEIPQITALTPPLPTTYLEGQQLQFGVSFDESVIVTGVPRLTFDLNGNMVNATYVTGSGSQSLLFSYTVQGGDLDLDGILPLSPINLAGATIRDAAGNSADLTYATGTIPTVLIDGTKPYVTNLIPPIVKNYLLGETLQLQVQFSSNVDVTGTPRVEFTNGALSSHFEYSSGSGTDTLLFEYVVILGDQDLDGIELSGVIDLNGGTILDAELDAADLNFTAPLTPSTFIDATRAKVTSIVKPADQEYGDSEELFFILNFDQAITVSGIPEIQLQLDSGLVSATYQSGSTTSNLVFRYTVQSGDTDSDGIEIQNNILLAGGTLIGGNTLDVDLDISAAVALIDTTGVIINPVSLIITSITAPLDDTYIETENIDFIVNTSTPVNVTGTPRLSIDIGGVTKSANYLSGTGTSALTFRYVVEVGVEDLDGIALNPPLDLNGGTIQDGGLVALNTSFTAPNLSSVFVDSLAPALAITTPINLSYINSSTDSAFFTVSGTCNENGETVKIEVDSAVAISPVDFLCDGTNFTGTIDTTGLTEAVHTLQAKLMDTSGNEGISTLINITKDTTAPAITTLTPPSDGTYNTGENLDFILDFDEAIEVTNVPRLELDLDGNTVYADYFSGTGTAALTYRYVVQVADSDSDGVEISNNNIDLNTTGGLTDLAGNNSTLDFTAFAPDLSSILINVTAVTITSITAPLDSTYIEAENLDFIVNTSELVNVTGVPRLILDIGGSLKHATYLSGTGTSALTFRYSIESGLEDLDGVTLSSSVDLNGGTIEGGSSQALDATFTSPDLSLVLVDSSAPVVAITSPVEASFINLSNDSATFTINGTCNESGETVIIEIDSAAAASPIGFVCDGANFTGTIDTTGLTEAAHTIDAKLSDDALNEGMATTINVVRDVTAPSISSIVSPIDKTWIRGETLSFSLTYNENIAVSGTPNLAVTVGGSTLNFDYVSGSGTSTLVFNLTLVGGEEDTDGLVFNSSLINLAGGTIIDTAANDSNLNLDANIALPNLSAVLVDAILPLITITSAPDISSSNHTSYNVIGTCSEQGQTVSVSIGGITVTPTCSSGSWSTSATDVSGLADNPALPITADHNDVAGNNAIQATTTVNKSVAVPLVRITSAPNISQANHTAYSVSGTCSENGRVVDVVIGSIPVSPNCSGGAWSTADIDVSGEADSGSFSITADHDNAALVVATQASVTVVKDTLAPTVTISSAPAITNDNQTSYMVSGTCSENGRTVDVFIDTLNYLPTCAAGAWTTGFVDVSSLTDDPAIPITADHDNAALDPADQASTTVVMSTTTPTVSNLTASSSLSSSIELQWTITDPGGFTLNDHIINYRIKGTPTWLTFDDGMSVSNSTTVTGLDPSTTYEFRVALTYDITETSEFTNVAEGTTLPDDPLFDGPHKAMNVGGSTDTNVVAYYDGTRVYLNGVEIAASPLDKGEVANITTARYDVIDADGPIYTAGELGSGNGSSGGNIVWNPTSWAGKTFNFNATRSNPQTVWVYATENTTVEVKSGTTVLDTLTLTAGNGGELSWSVFGSYQLISTGTVLAYHISGTGDVNSLQDPKPLLPAALEIIGFPSNSMTLTTDSDATNYNLIHGNSATEAGAMNRSSAISIANQGDASLYAGNSLLISADKKISGYSYADSNGLCAAPFLPTNLMKKRYIINSNADYVAFASKVAGTIDVYSPTQTIGVSTPVQVLTLTRSGANPNAPYNARVGTTTEGYRFVATVPVAGWYQPDNSTGSGDKDETILHGTNL